MIEIIGWISAISFAICAIPQALQSFREGHSNGVNTLFLLFWMLGEVAGMVYVVMLGSYPLIFNYLFNGVFLGVIIYFKLFPRRKQ